MMLRGTAVCHALIAAFLLGVLLSTGLTVLAQGMPPMRFFPPPPMPLGTGLPGISIPNTLTPLDLKCTLCDIHSAPDVRKNYPDESKEDHTESSAPSADELVAQGVQYYRDGNFQAAAEEFKKAGNARGAVDGLKASYSMIAMTAMQDGHIATALGAADDLRDIDRKSGTLLRGDILLRINALPLAMETYQPYADDENVQRILASLDKSGYGQFQRLEMRDDGWVSFEIQYRGVDLERPVRYLFRKINGREIPAPYALVSERPAPRNWSFKLLWWAITHWTWPETKNLKEYRLTVNSANASDIVEFWEGMPSDEAIMAAAKIGIDAADGLRDAEKNLHDGDTQEAFFGLRGVTGADWSYSNPSRHYGALVSLIRVALIKDQTEADNYLNILKYRYPYWGQLAWASLLVEENHLAEASEVLEKTADEYLLRYEALEQLVDIQWTSLQEAPAENRMELGRKMQHTLARLLSRRPGLVSARLRLAEWHLMLSAYAPASDILKEIDQNNPDTEASTMLAALKAQRRDTFEVMGVFANAQKGLTFRVYRSLSDPPEQGTIIHHAAEVEVLDNDGNHLETFAISSQALSDQSTREYFLDRITTDGLQTLVRYGDNPVPSALDLGQSLAKL